MPGTILPVYPSGRICLASVHSWSDRTLIDRMIALEDFVATVGLATGGSGNGDQDFLSEWRANRSVPNGGSLTGYGVRQRRQRVRPPAATAARCRCQPADVPVHRTERHHRRRQTVGSCMFGSNTDGVAQYGLCADWTIDLIRQAAATAPCCGSS